MVLFFDNLTLTALRWSKEASRGGLPQEGRCTEIPHLPHPKTRSSGDVVRNQEMCHPSIVGVVNSPEVWAEDRVNRASEDEIIFLGPHLTDEMIDKIIFLGPDMTDEMMDEGIDWWRPFVASTCQGVDPKDDFSRADF
mmetsp:Transcript_21041/g.56090  ORF Transcript_21041/g.56090 Transcript_21041/m.56090 type:complete len:138 (-) Transcript_21041:263-676(-)